MKLKLKDISLTAGIPIALISEKTSKKLGISVGERVEISRSKEKLIARLDTSKNLLKDNELALSSSAIKFLKVKPSNLLSVKVTSEPKSIQYIVKKINGRSLNKKEIATIVCDIVNNSLSEAEISYFVSAVYEQGLTKKETISLVDAMYRSGEVLSWPSKKIADKHCIGGIAGNRTTPLVVSICSALGVKMPKTSSRAITSAAGTADVIETLASIDLSSSEIKRVVDKVGACLAWNGSFSLSPADDKLIKVERLLHIDPKAQLIASILSKKIAAGSKYVLIDIPYGKGAKVSKSQALDLKKNFIAIAHAFKLKLKVVLTPGSQPIGNGIGPNLEMRDVLSVLKQKSPPKDLQDKSVYLAGKILELIGLAKKGQGESMALQALTSGSALKQFKKIIKAQNGSIDRLLKLGKFKHTLRSPKTSKIKSIDNKKINWTARILGCPKTKTAGLYLHSHTNQILKKGDPIITFYAQSPQKLKDALAYYKREKPILLK